MLRVQDGGVLLKGPHTARIFWRGEKPVEAAPGGSLQALLEETDSPVGRVA